MKTIAIYTRKSNFTKQGDSVENQVEICKTYLKSRLINEELSFLIYEDDGFSGANIDRPSFKKLLDDINKKAFSILICYRLDRISRNVAHFSTILSSLEKNKIDFISVKEQFDTTSPLGRAMMYISSVFAQLERETISERVKDNLLELSKKGYWLGGTPPFGYKNIKTLYMNKELKEKSFSLLSPVISEINLIKLIYSKFLEFNSIPMVSEYLTTTNIASLSNLKLKRLLSSPLYVKSNNETHKYLLSLKYNVFGVPNGNGYLSYNKKNNPPSKHIYSVSCHKGIISPTDWLAIQSLLNKSSRKTSNRLGTSSYTPLLSSIFKCSFCGCNMIIKKGGKNKLGIPYLYYICSNSKKKLCINPSVRVDYIDNLIIKKFNLDGSSVNQKKIILKTLKNATWNGVEKNLILKEKNFEASS